MTCISFGVRYLGSSGLFCRCFALLLFCLNEVSFMLFCFVLNYTHEQQHQILFVFASSDWGQALPVIFFHNSFQKGTSKASFSPPHTFLFLLFFFSCSKSVVIEGTDPIRCLESSSPIDTLTEAGAWHLSGSNLKC